MNIKYIGIGVLTLTSCLALASTNVLAVTADDVSCKGCVHGHDIKNGAVTKKKLKRDSVSTAKLQDGAVINSKIATDAVTGDKIERDAVGSFEISDGAVGTSEIADGSVTEAKLASLPKITMVHRQFTESFSGTESVEKQIECPPGTQLIGGGGFATGDTVVADAHPGRAISPGDYWIMGWRSRTGTALNGITLGVTAICVSGFELTDVVDLGTVP